MTGRVTALGIRDGDPAVLRALIARRGSAVLAYCERACAPARVPDAAADAFARFRALVVAAPRPAELDPEAALLSCTRRAAADRAPRAHPAAQGAGLGRLLAGRSTADQMGLVPELLIARADGTLDTEGQEQLARLLDASATARAAEERFRTAEHAYRSAPSRAIAPDLVDRIVAAMAVVPAPGERPQQPAASVAGNGAAAGKRNGAAHRPTTAVPAAAAVAGATTTVDPAASSDDSTPPTDPPPTETPPNSASIGTGAAPSAPGGPEPTAGGAAAGPSTPTTPSGSEPRASAAGPSDPSGDEPTGGSSDPRAGGAGAPSDPSADEPTAGGFDARAGDSAAEAEPGATDLAAEPASVDEPDAATRPADEPGASSGPGHEPDVSTRSADEPRASAGPTDDPDRSAGTPDEPGASAGRDHEATPSERDEWDVPSEQLGAHGALDVEVAAARVDPGEAGRQGPAARGSGRGKGALAPAAAVVAVAAVSILATSGILGGDEAQPPVDTGVAPKRTQVEVPEGEAAAVVDELRRAADRARRQRLADTQAAAPVAPPVETAPPPADEAAAEPDEPGTPAPAPPDDDDAAGDEETPRDAGAANDTDAPSGDEPEAPAEDGETPTAEQP